MAWKHLLWIALGGSLGSVSRFYGQKFFGLWLGQDFPMGTLIVNIAGCLLIGVFYDLSSRIAAFNPEFRLLLMTGFCGGFTTFSAFGLESMALIQQQKITAALLYATISVVAGIGATFSGYWVSRNFFN